MQVGAIRLRVSLCRAIEVGSVGTWEGRVEVSGVARLARIFHEAPLR